MRSHEIAKGSSPHTRGASGAGSGFRCGRRIIPAYAGRFSRRGLRATRVGDHPRIRGALRVGGGGYGQGAGSSPHTRGAYLARDRVCGGGRIIPAYAGRLRRRPRRPLSSGDHPRIRGALRSFCSAVRVSAGSSPHTRGASRRRRRPVRPARIIPAYAGRLVGVCVLTPRRWDHPRIRGALSAPGGGLTVSGGSSPHTRGASGAGRCRRELPGIIPAYAGRLTSHP